MKTAYFLIMVGISLLFFNHPIPAYAQNDNLSCQGFTLSQSPLPNHNGMPVYLGIETISITVTGSTSSQNIEVYWRPAYEVMSSSGWNKINGSYDSNSHIFTANWNLKNDSNIQDPLTGQARPQEIIISANNLGSSGFCSGNACSSQYPEGAYWATGGGVVCASTPASGCSGCQKKIIIDPTANLNSSNAIDVKEYMLFNPGNYWEFDGTNFTYPESDPLRYSKTRIEIEPPTLMCGHKAIGMRFLKDKISGYWGEKFAYFDPGRWGGALALRNSMFYFDGDPKWDSGFTGSPWFTTFNLLESPNQLKGLGSSNAVFGYMSSGSQHFYYTPYLYAPRYLPADPTRWRFKREDTIYTNTNPVDNCAYEASTIYETRGHRWETKYGWENVETPKYTGQALRIIFIESVGNSLLREDYFFAKNIGLVMIKVKDIYQKSKHETGTGTNRNNCGSQCDDNTPMTDPMLIIKLRNYYLGTPLQISSAITRIKPQTTTVYWPVQFASSYTGAIDYKVDQLLADGSTKTLGTGYWKDVWVQDGLLHVPVPRDVLRGTFIYAFRRHQPDLPTSVLVRGEVVDDSFVSKLAWSNSLSMTYTDTAPLPGDFITDGHVNIFDYNALVAGFGTTYTIFDYNALVANFGK